MKSSEPHLPKSDPPLQEVRILGARLTFTDENEGDGSRDRPVFFMVHGVPGSVRDFRYLAPPLLPFARIIRVDLPGSGGSAPRRKALRSLEERARTVVALADHLRVDRFGIIGHSMGGGTALVTASMLPDRVTHLVMIASMGLRRHRGLSQTRTVFRAIAVGLRIPVVRDLLLRKIRPTYRKKKFPRSEEMTSEEFALQFDSFSAADYTVANRAVRKPLPSKCLVALADDDHLVESEIPLELAAAIPGARALHFADGGHIIQKTKAPEIARAILEL
ncbi:MAG: alpha/beta hydrolase [Vicinamibacteria bacterium]